MADFQQREATTMRAAAQQLAKVVKPSRSKDPVNDHGPKILTRRGKLKIHPSRVLEDAADPDQPNRTIRRARVQWLPDVWLAKKVISQEQHDAATRFVMAYEMGVLGAKDRSFHRISFGRVAPAGLANVQLFCITDYRQAEEAVGMSLSAALAWCVLSTGTVEGWAECKGWHRDRAAGYLMAALDRLVEHYRKIGRKAA